MCLESAISGDVASRAAISKATAMRTKRCRVFMRVSPFSCTTVNGGPIPSLHSLNRNVSGRPGSRSQCLSRLGTIMPRPFCRQYLFLPQCRKFFVDFGENSQIGVGLLPQSNEVVIGLPGLRGVAGKRGGTGQAWI